MITDDDDEEFEDSDSVGCCKGITFTGLVEYMRPEEDAVATESAFPPERLLELGEAYITSMLSPIYTRKYFTGRRLNFGHHSEDEGEDEDEDEDTEAGRAQLWLLGLEMEIVNGRGL